jgi:hypothetical protein
MWLSCKFATCITFSSAAEPLPRSSHTACPSVAPLVPLVTPVGTASGVAVADVLAVGLVLRVPRSVLRGIAFARAGTEENG